MKVPTQHNIKYFGCVKFFLFNLQYLHCSDLSVCDNDKPTWFEENNGLETTTFCHIRRDLPKSGHDFLQKNNFIKNLTSEKI